MVLTLPYQKDAWLNTLSQVKWETTVRVLHYLSQIDSDFDSGIWFSVIINVSWYKVQANNSGFLSYT